MHPPPATDFFFWWHLPGEWLEAPNSRRGGTSGVVRHQPDAGPALYIKKQQGHLFRSLRYPLGRPTCLREALALDQFRGLGVVVPTRCFFGLHRAEQWWGVLVTEALPPGFVSLDEWYGAKDSAAVVQKRMAVVRELARTLAILHRHRWQHSSLMTKHIFVRVRAAGLDCPEGSAEIALIDLERARRWLTVGRASRRDLFFLRQHLPYWTDAEWAEFNGWYRRMLRD
jgi:hypothetical protein